MNCRQDFTGKFSWIVVEYRSTLHMEVHMEKRKKKKEFIVGAMLHMHTM